MALERPIAGKFLAFVARKQELAAGRLSTDLGEYSGHIDMLPMRRALSSAQQYE
jgi:hypothetical protein